MKKQKLKSPMMVLLMVSLSIFATLSLGSRSPAHQFQEAIDLMETKGNYPAAIHIFEELSKGEDRNLAARALYHVGLCYEKLGKEEAQKAYRRLISEFTDQKELVTEASARLAALTRATGSSNASGMVIRRLWRVPSQLRVTGVVWDERYVTFVNRQTGDLGIRDLVTGKNRRLTHNKVPGAESAMGAHISRDGKRVVYSWSSEPSATWASPGTDGSVDLRVVGLDGSQPRVLYRHEEVNRIAPRGWSPDGKHILTVFGRKDGTVQIGMVSVTDGSVRVLKSLNWGSPMARLSPDGRYIAYEAQPEIDSREDIFLLATDGSREIPLVQRPGDDDVVEWTPDGRGLLIVSGRAEHLWLIRLADGKPHGPPELVKRNMRNSERGMSSKGSLYYTTGSVNTTDASIATLDPTTGQVLVPPTPVSQRFVRNTRGADWSPDGKYLAYGIFLEAGSNLIAVRSNETGEERYFSLNVRPFGPRWSPDGRSILIGDRDLYQMDAQTGDLTPIVRKSPGVYARAAVWSPEGRDIFYSRIDARTYNVQIMRRNLETGQETELHRVDAPGGRVLAISPDGRRLAFPAPGDRPFGVLDRPTTVKLIPTAGGEPQEIFTVKEPEGLHRYVLTWMPDGQHLLIGKHDSRRPNPTELWRIPVGAGQPQKLEFEIEEGQRLGGLRVHPDGRQIAFTVSQWVQELWVMENFLPELQAAK